MREKTEEIWADGKKHIRYQLKCGCGEIVRLDRFTNTCECGRDYNMDGSLLAPRSQWGEETGETASDIIAADFDRWDGDIEGDMGWLR